MLANNPKVGEYRLVIRSLEGSEEKILTEGLLNEQLVDPAWSPDGKTIVSQVYQPGEALSGLVAIEVESGKRHLFVTSNDMFFQRPVWLADGSGLLVLGAGPHFTQTQIVFVSFPAGKLSPVTRDANAYADLTLAADGHTLATILSQTRLNPYVMPDGAGTSQARQLNTGSPITSVSWTRDGQLITSAGATGLTLLNPDSGAKTPFLSQIPLANFASACSDGHIVFSAPSEGKIQNNIWQADADGGNHKKLTSGKFDFLPLLPTPRLCSTRTLTELEKVPLEGGASQQILDLAVFSRITISPDGKFAAFVTFRLADPKEKLVLLPLDSSQPPWFLEFERPRTASLAPLGDAPIRFASDSKAVIYPVRDGDTDNLWLQHLDGSPGNQLPTSSRSSSAISTGPLTANSSPSSAATATATSSSSATRRSDALAYLQLGRAFVMAGDTAKARSCAPGLPLPFA